VPVAAVTTAIVGIPQAAGHLTLGILAAAIGLGLLHPVTTFALEMLALRHMTPNAFGTLMAIEPAIGVVLGLIVLHQTPTVLQVLGVLLVITAGTAPQRDGRRRPAAERTAASPRIDLLG
jgi:inner membrane transporter RhtA